MRRIFRLWKKTPSSPTESTENRADHFNVPTPARIRYQSRSRSRSPVRRLSYSAAECERDNCTDQIKLSLAHDKESGQQVLAPGSPLSGQVAAGSALISLVKRRSLSGPPRRSKRSAVCASRRSFIHRDFANPQAETCWLSCLFQTLWHSVVFHTAFEDNFVPQKYTPQENERILTALQQTWVEYKTEQQGTQQGSFDETNAGASSEPQAETDPQLVPACDLAEAFGEGYGDMAEALALLQGELSQSLNAEAVKLAECMALVPLVPCEDGHMSPDYAWRQVVEWQLTTAPILAVDINVVGTPTKDSSAHLAQEWIPSSRLPKVMTDLGTAHKLVALVCFMWDLQHYVAFCRRQRDPNRCLFFNDLPELTKGVCRDLAWCEVPSICKKYFLIPRLALYEIGSV